MIELLTKHPLAAICLLIVTSVIAIGIVCLLCLDRFLRRGGRL